MKNKSEKLARNAIRARKAKNKRANEQDKPKKGKRWLIRLGSLMGCLLLVSALVVPCFADAIYDDHPSFDMYDAFIEYGVPSVFSNNAVFLDLVNLYKGTGLGGTSELFGCDVLVYSNSFFDGFYALPNNNGLPYSFILSEDTEISYRIPVEGAVFNMSFDDRDLSTFELVIIDDGEINVYIKNNGDDVIVSVNILGVDTDGNGYFVQFVNYAYTYTGSDNVTISGLWDCTIKKDTELYFNGGLESIEAAFTVRDISSDDFLSEGLGLVCSYFFYMPYSPYIHPQAFANGYTAGQTGDYTYTDGYNDGYSSGYNTGLNEGYNEGYSEGYNEGYVVGFDEGYDTGYNAVVDSSASANLGKNLLGQTFSAPFAVLKSVPIVEWETESGTVSITVYTLLMALIAFSLAVWFLKMFAGG